MAPFNLNSIPARFDNLERRVGQIEDTLKLILDHLPIKAPDAESTSRQALSIQEAPVAIKSGPYTYHPLDSSRNEIRVLSLLNSPNDKDPIKCDLLHISLDEDLKASGRTRLLRTFATLSYTWGSMDQTSLVFIKGHEFKITKNLEAALRHLRKIKRSPSQPDKESESYWWVDALCINQDDILERNYQVTLMTRIFKNGLCCHIWLGEEAENSAMAMDLVKKLGTEPTRGPGEPEINYPDLSVEQKILHWKALAALFQRSWWERAWVRQEVAVGKFSLVHCGNSTGLLHELTAAAKILNGLRAQLGPEMLQHESVEERKVDAEARSWMSPFALRACLLAELRERRGLNNKFLDLKELIFHARTCKATDDRDKVFAMLGLVDPEVYELKPDYRLSPRETFSATARGIIRKTKGLDILSACQNPERLYGLPSWAPNLMDDWKAQPFRPRRGSRLSDKDLLHVFEEGTDLMRLKGVCLGLVETLSRDTIHQDDTKEQLDAIYRSWQNLAAEALSSPKLQELHRGYIRDRLLDGYKDRAWVSFLSIGEDAGHGMKFSDQGELLPERNESLDKIRNIRFAKSLLLLDDPGVNVSIYKRIHAQLRVYGVGRRLCLSETGSISLVPADATKGDLIVFFRGANFPYILRKCEENYVLVGEAFPPPHINTQLG